MSTIFVTALQRAKPADDRLSKAAQAAAQLSSWSMATPRRRAASTSAATRCVPLPNDGSVSEACIPPRPLRRLLALVRICNVAPDAASARVRPPPPMPRATLWRSRQARLTAAPSSATATACAAGAAIRTARRSRRTASRTSRSRRVTGTRARCAPAAASTASAASLASSRGSRRTPTSRRAASTPAASRWRTAAPWRHTRREGAAAARTKGAARRHAEARQRRLKEDMFRRSIEKRTGDDDPDQFSA